MLIRRTVRVIATVSVATLLIALGTTPAFAGGGSGGVQCDEAQQNPGCDVSAGSSGGTSEQSDPINSGGSGGGKDNCVYEPAYPSAAVIAALGGQPSGEGGWYFKTCVNDNGVAFAYPGPIWIPGAPPTVSLEALARQARSRLELPSVVVQLNPVGDQLVNLPTWLSLSSSSWQSQSAQAHVPGVTVTATARPLRATWSMGDGGSVVCNGPGSAWPRGTDPMKASPDCGYTYQRSSAAAPGATFAVTVTVMWEVTWAGAGRTGVVPGLTTTGTTQVPVQESQAVISN